MQLQDIERLAERYALATFLTEWEGSNYDEIIIAFNNDTCPDDVSIWYPFEDYNLVSLSENIEALRNDFLTFARKINQ